ncbi:MAG TPA: cyclic nucleotide-binding domain-containing protein [Acidimicrobiales bacterium]|nr:cyclic nucleotide-binding domain-containing protein [Acidimicrobiales bacterium]
MVTRFLRRDKIAILSRLPLFEACTKRELASMASLTVDTERPAGSVLTREGRDGGLMFVIVDGEAEVERDGKVIKRLGPGDVIGELSLIDGLPRSANVRAVTDTRVLELARDDFRTLADGSPKFVRNLLRALSLRIRDMDERWPAELR